MAPEIVRKIASLIRNLVGENKNRTETELKRDNLPRKTSVLRQAEIVLFADAVVNGKTLIAEEIPWGAPISVFPASPEEGRPERYSTWPNFPGERERTRLEFIKVEPLTATLRAAGGSIVSGDNFALRVRPVLNDDREKCFFSGVRTEKNTEQTETAGEYVNSPHAGENGALEKSEGEEKAD